MRKTLLMSAALAASGAFGAASASTLDLTLDGLGPNGGSPEAFAGALWETGELYDGATGTGVFNPFLRVQANGSQTSEQGYNTDRKQSDVQFDEKAGGAWTRSIELASLKVVDGYYRFALDMQEDKGKDKPDDVGPDAWLSIQDFRLYSTDDSDINGATFDPSSNVWSDPTVKLHYALDTGGDNRVDLDYRVVGKGNGRPDLFVYVAASYFTDADKYLVLYTRMGDECTESVPVAKKDKPVVTCTGYKADSSFEEWAALEGEDPPPPPPPVPLPAAGFLLAGGLGALVALRRKAKSA